MARPARLTILLTTILAPIALLTAVWGPVAGHYGIPTPGVTDSMVSQARELPGDTVLSELSRYYFFPTGLTGDSVAVAEQLLRGEVKIAGLEARHVTLPFAARDLDNGPIIWQLFVGRLTVPRVLVAAYRRSGDTRFLVAARDVVLAWADYEGRALFPRGLLWNDHAIAERVQVLSEFWLAYRNSPAYDPAVGRRVLRFAARSGEFLADSLQFTGTTNHGAMQNLALLHLSLAFPTLAESPAYARLAVRRLEQQLQFYVSPEGVILEHSAGYQRFGIQVLGTAMRYMTLAGLPIPPGWSRSYGQAKAMYGALRRPDGTLPLYGDTESPADLPGPLVAEPDPTGAYPPLQNRSDWRPFEDDALYPVAGYAIHWDGLAQWPEGQALAQTVVAWSSYPSRVHKHSDEMSVLYWAAGHSWWTNVGYWPYDAGRGDAEGWNGSNAPHLRGEEATSPRATRLLRYRDDGPVTFLDLERRGPGSYVARRQVLGIRGEQWVVLDRVTGGDNGVTTTIWGTSPGTDLEPGGTPGNFTLRHPPSGTGTSAWLVGVPTPALRVVQGSKAPFAGWQMVEFPEPTRAIIQEQPGGDAWSVMAWSRPSLDPGAPRLTSAPTMTAWSGPERWQLALPLAGGSITVARAEDSLTVAGGGAPGITSTLVTPAPVDSAVTAIHQAFARVAASYPRFQDELPYRIKVTQALLALLLAQELMLLAWRRLARRPDTWLRLAAVGCWALVGAYFLFVRVRLF